MPQKLNLLHFVAKSPTEANKLKPPVEYLSELQSLNI